MLAPHIQERVKGIVRTSCGLTTIEEHDFSLIVSKFNALDTTLREQINVMTLTEYSQLSPEQQKELRFLVLHSKAFKEAISEMSQEDLFKEYSKTSPTGTDIETILHFYPQLDEEDLRMISPALLASCSKDELIHAVSLLTSYKLNSVQKFHKKTGINIENLPALLEKEHPSIGEIAEKMLIIEAMATLFRTLEVHQQKELLDMTLDEAKAFINTPEALARVLFFLKESPSTKELSSHLFEKEKISPEKLLELFNKLEPSEKAEFRQQRQLVHHSVEPLRNELAQIDEQLKGVHTVLSQNRQKLEHLVFAQELIEKKAEDAGRLKSDTETAKVQRYNLEASRYAARIDVYEERMIELFNVRKRLAGLLTDIGEKVEDIILDEDVALFSIAKDLLVEHEGHRLTALKNQIETAKTKEELEPLCNHEKKIVEDMIKLKKEEIGSMKNRIEELSKPSSEAKTPESTREAIKKKAEISMLERRIKIFEKMASIVENNLEIILDAAAKQIAETKSPLGKLSAWIKNLPHKIASLFAPSN